MTRRPAVTNATRLEEPLYLNGGMCTDVITTIGEAATFIVELPTDWDGRLHWMIAGAALEAAHQHQDNSEVLSLATKAMRNALASENMLQGAALASSRR